MSKKIKTTGNKKSILTKIAIGVLIFIIASIVVSFTMKDETDEAIMTFASGNKTETIQKSTTEIVEAMEVVADTEEEETIDELVEEIQEPAVNDKYTIYCVVAGDSYSKICKNFYGNADLCWALMEYNGANGDSRLSVLQEIKIPDIENEEFRALCETAKPPVVEKKPAIQTTTANNTNQTKAKATNTNYSAPTTSGSVRNNTGSVDTSGFTYLGSYKITGYTPGCAHCCGSTAGITASGVPAKVGRTIAAKGFSFGTTLYIKGYGFYVVEDTGGFGSGTIDMAAGSHEECYSITNSGVDVYLVSNN